MDDELPLGSLGPVENDTRQKLGQLLWEWKLCGECDTAPSCTQRGCPWSRAETLRLFWDLYERMTDAYCPERLGRKAALSSHGGLIDMMRTIKECRSIARQDLLLEHFEAHRVGGDRPPTLNDQNRAFNIGASLLLMMDFGVLHDAANSVEGNHPRIQWRDRVSMNNFVDEAFPSMLTKVDMRSITVNLTAMQLKKNGKLRLKATNDVRRHLVVDHEERTVWVFQHDSMLRELLRAGDPNQYAGVLPRELILELLDTIHIVLFPSNPESYKLLESLVSKNRFDSGLLTLASVPYRKSGDPEVSYTYFGERLVALKDELQSPRPHGWLQERLGRKRDTYMLMATMVGVFIAVLIGLLGLCVSTFQAWVAYQQWKHPKTEA
ncbi:hypothetical protein CC86DRAFT_468904 [Ophiobolus disseminans]|uniref:Uncharacterized protein n=1 Tax=Ophiobolus disseminans TaxID=1469910 RepID=A0A6A6ZT20_9PLEO|nr:hypothetical protein CC86DRAFT_468904 [Ophiobolus disseminans]